MFYHLTTRIFWGIEVFSDEKIRMPLQTSFQKTLNSIQRRHLVCLIRALTRKISAQNQI